MLNPLTWNCDQEALPNGRKLTRFGVKHCNFLRADGAWQGIDARPAQVGNVLQIANAPYKLEAPLTADGDFRFEATVRYDIHRKAGIASAATGLVKRFPGALPVAAQVDGYLIRYPLAMPSIGADIVIRPHEQKVNFLYEWQSAPVGSGPIECPVEFEFDGIPEVARRVGNRSIATTNATLSEPLTWQANSNRGVTIKPAKVWDSLGRLAPVQLRLRRQGNRLVGVKLVPRAFLAKAFADGAAWVRSDTTSTFYPDADAESTSVDGIVGHFSFNDTWANVRGGAGNQDGQDTSQSSYVARGQMGSDPDTFTMITRGVYLFDTSVLPDTDTVSAAEFSVYGTATTAGAQWTDYFMLVTSNPASNTALVSADYTTLGSAEKGTSGFSAGGWNTSGYNTISLNDTTLIAKTGITKLGVRQYNDYYDSAPTWEEGSNLEIQGYFADETGTGSDPKLVVTHAAAATGNKSNLMLLGIGG